VSHPEDFLTLGERVVVKIVSINGLQRKVELTLRDVADKCRACSRRPGRSGRYWA